MADTEIHILRQNGHYLGAFRESRGAMEAGHRHAVRQGNLHEGQEVTWESDGDPRPGHEGLWMWTGEYCMAYEVRADRLR